ncbi:MAG: aldo/keto reductase [Erysipelotrichales bacterium]|nr:aldo/keto reductase [Erysipelotrichales bacterium]
MKKLGFGCMRLPLIDGKVDLEQFSEMIKIYFENGFNYFDTAHGYIDGQSETAIRECLTSKYPRDSYILTNKLSSFYIHKEEDVRVVFEEQLKACGVDYFDYYLMHAQNAELFKLYKECHAYEVSLKLKEEGKIKHFGISFHDKAAVLEEILTEYPQIEVVQIQFNYLDYDSQNIESRKCYEVCRKFNKDVIIMEPVKGGALVDLPFNAQKIFDELNGGSNASYAIRFTASFEGVIMVLSGMSNIEQMKDNVAYMKDFVPFSKKEFETVKKVADIIKYSNVIPCTACRYCVDGCPKKILIPDLFACMNQKRNQLDDWNSRNNYRTYTQNNGMASNCIKCGKCETICPQHLKIRKLLEEVSNVFDKRK